MYSYTKPTPIVISLAGKDGFELRVEANEFVNEIKVRGLEAGSAEEQSYGILAQMVIRKELGLPKTDPEKRPLGFDILLPTKVRVDVKCRSGTRPFQEEYEGSGGTMREAKHNFFARQIWDAKLETDIYLMTHLQIPKKKMQLPGTNRQKNWNLYICGWVSKSRVKEEGVYLPRGSLTERARSWFPYRADEIEFYHPHLNGLANLRDLLRIDQKDVEKDTTRSGNLHLTSVDSLRIATHLVARGIISTDVLEFLRKKLGLDDSVFLTLHPNQYFHLVKWLKSIGKASDHELEKLEKIMTEVKYTNKNNNEK